MHPIHCKWKMALKRDAECSQTLLTCALLMWNVILLQLINKVQFVGSMRTLLWQKKNPKKTKYNLDKSLQLH